MGCFPKTDKITRVLTLYHQLINGQHIDKSVFSLEHGINERSFDRDIEDIRLFLSEIFSARELVFDKETASYYLTGDKPSFLDRMDATIIAKLLLSSNALRQDEMKGLFETLLSAVTPRDANAVRDYLYQDTIHYETKTESAILKTLEDLYVAIQSGADVEVVLRHDEQLAVKRLSPLEITMADSLFILVGSEDMKLSNIVRYPLDHIVSFKLLHSSFARTLQSQYHQQKR